MKGSKGSILRPLVMVAFVMVMVFLMQQNIEEKQELQEQQTEIDPGSVIYSDMGAIEGTFPDEKPVEVEEELLEEEEGGTMIEETNVEK